MNIRETIMRLEAIEELYGDIKVVGALVREGCTTNGYNLFPESFSIETSHMGEVAFLLLNFCLEEKELK